MISQIFSGSERPEAKGRGRYGLRLLEPHPDLGLDVEVVRLIVSRSRRPLVLLQDVDQLLAERYLDRVLLGRRAVVSARWQLLRPLDHFFVDIPGLGAERPLLSGGRSRAAVRRKGFTPRVVASWTRSAVDVRFLELAPDREGTLLAAVEESLKVIVVGRGRALEQLH